MKARMKVLSFLLIHRINNLDDPDSYQFNVDELGKKVGTTYVTTWKELDELWNTGYVNKLKKKRGGRVINHYEASEDTMETLMEEPQMWILNLLQDIVEW